MNEFKIVLCTLFCIVISSCSIERRITYFQNSSSEPVVVPDPQPIRLHAGDKLDIRVHTRNNQLQNILNIPALLIPIASMLNSENIYDFSDLDRSAMGVSLYLVDDEGNIDFPTLGKISVAGLTREEVETRIKDGIISNNQADDVVVIVDFGSLFYYVMGEVNRPGRYIIDNDVVTIIDALSRAGDMTIYGRRDRVFVKRTIDGTDLTIPVNLLKTESLVKSPAFYLQQNDLVYIEPNNMRKRQSSGPLNNWLSASVWVSIASVGVSALRLLLR